MRLARMFGFRFDPARDAYVLRLVGNRFGPVLQHTPRDGFAAQLEWADAMEQLAEHRRQRPGRFAREPLPTSGVRHDVIER